MEQTNELLVPLVNAPHQEAAIERAFSGFTDAELTVLNVVTPLDEPFSEGNVLPVTEERQVNARARARDLVETASGQREQSADIVVTEDRPVPAVVEHVREGETDRVVIGGRDTSAIENVLFGRSVAAVVDDRTEVPVTVVSEPG